MIKLEATNDKPFKSIWIKWNDSMSYNSEWYFIGEAARKIANSVTTCESIGYLIYENSEKLAICDSLAYGDDGNICGVHSIHIIPISAIIDWKYLS